MQLKKLIATIAILAGFGAGRLVAQRIDGGVRINGGLSSTVFTTGLSNSGQALPVVFSLGPSQISSFNIAFGATTNAGDANRGDADMAIGWNTKGDGSQPLVAGEPSIMWRFENYFRPAATNCNTSPHGCQEAHLQWLSSDGTTMRPIGFQGIDNLKNVAISIDADAFSYLSTDGMTQYFKFSPGSLNALNSSIFQVGTNNVNAYQQVNNAGNRFNALIWTNNSDLTIIGDPTATNGTKGFLMRSTDTVQLEWNGGTAPTCTTNCGTPGNVVSGNNINGRITMGTTPASGFQVNFNGSWTNTPHCNVWMSLGTMVTGKKPIVVATTTGNFVVTTDGTAPVAGDTYDYHCESN